MALLQDLFLVMGALTFVVIALYLFFGGLFRAFQRVGFTPGQASLIILGTFIGGRINLPLFEVNDWVLAINVGGAIVPLVVTFVVLKRHPSLIVETLAGATLVALVTFLVTTPTEQGIVSPFPLYLLPPIVAAGLSLVALWREEEQSAPLAYMIGTLGAIIGADVFRLGAFLSQAPPEPGAVAAIGGAAVLDMVYLTGILAVGLDALYFNRLRKEQDPAPLPYEEHMVFRSSTSSDVIRDYSPPLGGSAGPRPTSGARAPSREGLLDRARRAADDLKREMEQASASGGGGGSGGGATTGTPSREERLSRHREWEERLRSGR